MRCSVIGYMEQVTFFKALPGAKAANITKTLVDAGISAEEICAAINAEDADRVKDWASLLLACWGQEGFCMVLWVPMLHSAHSNFCFLETMKLRSKVSSISDVHERGTAMGAEILLVAAKGSHAVRLVRRQGCNRSWRNPEFQ